ncbi:hypothetical protein MHX53_01540 [Brevibacterium sp. ACRRH]|uniref:hypothetical protein n=1 Tax=Brevibacterium sp. ACRRH TaxID=2918183 RepID=UPI001EF5B2DB|nr:hypothetical protein [Brevibacterium sp. ACRRH]MCG7297742.1 hypothetical protein [Brevibacterium sp. ACRRH]
MQPYKSDPWSTDLYGLPSGPNTDPRPSPAPLHGPLARPRKRPRARLAVTSGIIAASVLVVAVVCLALFFAP